MQQTVTHNQCTPSMMNLESQMLSAPDQVVASCLRVYVQYMQVLQGAGALQGLAAAMHVTGKLADISVRAETLALLTPRLLASTRLAAQVAPDTSPCSHLIMHSRLLMQGRGGLDVE